MSTQIDHTPSDDSFESGDDPFELIQISLDGDVLRIAGELDFDTVSPLFTSALLTGEPHEPLTLDMSEVRFIDSSAIGALLRAARERRIVIVNPSDQVRRVLEITSLTDVFGIS